MTYLENFWRFIKNIIFNIIIIWIILSFICGFISAAPSIHITDKTIAFVSMALLFIWFITFLYNLKNQVEAINIKLDELLPKDNEEDFDNDFY